MSAQDRSRPLFDAPIVRGAVLNSFIKLNPRTSGTFLQVLIYDNAFAGGNSKMGYASAMSWLMLVIILAVRAVTLAVRTRSAGVGMAPDDDRVAADR